MRPRKTRIVSRVRIIIAAALAIVAAPHVSLADDTHYQDFVIGGRAVVLGGAYASLSDDPSGIYYNPAGIADVRDTSLQLTTSLYGFERGSIGEDRPLPVPGVENLDIEFTDLIVIPASAGYVKTFGEKGRDGLPRQAYGFSVVVPSFRSFTARGSSASAADDNATYQRRVTDRELWSGLGYARKLGDRLSVGLSGYFILRSVVDLEDVTVSEEGGKGKFETVTNDITFINGSVVLIGGAKLKLLDRLAVGVAVQSPSVRVYSDASLQFMRARSDPLAPVPEERSSWDRADFTGASSNVRHSMAVRFGAHYFEPYKYTISVGGTYHAPVKYNLLKVTDAEDAVLFEEYRNRLPFNPRIERRGVLNLNAGFEFLVVREVSIAAGAFSDFSSAPKIAATPDSDQPPHVNLFGLTMALGYFGKHSLSRLGVVYSAGTGHDVIPQSDIDRVLGEDQSFERVKYFQSFFYIFLSSTFRY